MELSNEIIQKYLERRKQDLDNCLSFLARRDFHELEKIGHQLKGNGTTFGYPELSVIGKNLEQAAQAHDLTKLRAMVGSLFQWVKADH